MSGAKAGGAKAGGDLEISFVDTNVLVYGFEKSDSPKKVIAQSLLQRLMEADSLRLSTQVLQELFVTLTRKGVERCTTTEALAVMEDLAVWPVVVVDFGMIRGAVGLADEAKISFWDALVVVAAARAGASVLYTEDLSDGQVIFGMRIRNPFF
jgi:predicted nucleic acid-binding protein